LSEEQNNSEEMVIDFTRYDIKSEEPVSASTRNWSLMGEINQKQTRPQDKPIPLKSLGKDQKSLIKKYYPDLFGIK
jgi:hypothetical protein